ncbi:MAG: site-specific integrase [Bryobacteraceae bacterium]
MPTLRQKMTEDMQLRNLSPQTQTSYLLQVTQFTRHFGVPPETLGPEEIRAYQLHLLNERQLSPSSVCVAVAAIRFAYKVSLSRNWDLESIIPFPKKAEKLPVILSPEEVLAFLGFVASTKHRAILTACHAAGLRVSEAVHLKATDIDSQRMVIRVEQGKGRKDRYVMLSPNLLELLRSYWRTERPKEWLFPGDQAGRHITPEAVERICLKTRRRCSVSKPVTPHSFRHEFAVHLLESGTDIRTIQLLLGHKGLATTARYLRIATTKVCATTSPFDLPRRPRSS